MYYRCVICVALAGCLDQLSLLAKFAHELFDDLHQDCVKSLNKLNKIATKIEQVNDKLPNIERKFEGLSAWTYYDSTCMNSDQTYIFHVQLRIQRLQYKKINSFSCLFHVHLLLEVCILDDHVEPV